MTKLVEQRLVDGVAVVSLNRPERHNAMNDELIGQWRMTLAWAMETKEARAVLLRGEGSSFCSGRDTDELGARSHGESHLEVIRSAQEMPLRLAECPKPVVAALKGHTLGAGLEVALRADIRIAATNLSAGLPETAFGLIPDTGGCSALTALIGPSRAKWLIMAGERIGADDALAWGLVNEVVGPDDLDRRAMEITRRLAAAAPLAMAFAKQLVDDIAGAGEVRRGTRTEMLAQLALFASHDHGEARAAWRDGRTPDFEGR